MVGVKELYLFLSKSWWQCKLKRMSYYEREINRVKNKYFSLDGWKDNYRKPRF